VIALALLALGLVPSVSSATAPTATLAAPTAVETTRAQLSGTLDPADHETYYCFEYARTADLPAGWSGFCYEGPLSAGSGSSPLTRELTGLRAGTEYTARLTALNFIDPEALSEERTFTTDPAPVEPTPTISPATEVAYTSATLTGSVDPEGGNQESGGAYAPIHWAFETSTSGDPGTYSAALSGDLSGAQLESDAAIDLPESTTPLTGLASSTNYYYILALTYAGIRTETPPQQFTTEGPITAPSVSNVAFEDVSYLSANLTGEVELADDDPGFNATTCRFEYLTQDAWQANGSAFPEPEGAPSVPCDTQPAGSGSHQASAALGSLQPGTTYPLRLLAANQGGAGSSEAASTFTTLAVAKPTIENLTASAITGSSAHLSAEVDPGGSGDPAFDTAWSFECFLAGEPDLPACGGLQGGTVPAGEEQEVENDAKGLLPNRTYTLRLTATNAGGTRKATTSFSTPGAAPQINPFDAGPLTPTSADLNAEVNPNNAATVYWFEWGTEDCSTADCASLPASHEANAGSGPFFTYLLRTLTDLQPQTTYHFRVVAKNAFGIAEGPDRTFTTPPPEPACTNNGQLGAGFLPDCRAWEMVSPPDKNGIQVVPETDKHHIATDGDAVTFSALGAFADPQGSAIDTEYLARRTAAPATNGWATHAINPPERPVTYGAAVAGASSTYVDAFTPDLSAAVYKTWRPLVDAPKVSEVTNLYRIDGIGAGPTSAHILTDSLAPNPVPPTWATFFGGLFVKQYVPVFAGASADLSHVAFESTLDLTTDAPPYTGFCEIGGIECPTKVYENADGVVRLVSRIPQAPDAFCDDEAGPPCVAAESSMTALSSQFKFRFYSRRTVSDDGARVFFQSPATDLGSGPLYLREDGARTYRLAENGAFWDASRDGSRAFFTTPEALLSTDEDAAPDLYMFEAEKPAGQRLTLVSQGDSGIDGYLEGVLGASPDGHYVYFVNDGQLIAGAPPVGIVGLFVWHDGQLRFLGHFDSLGEVNSNSNRTVWAAPASAKASRATPDGRHFLFTAVTDAGFTGRGGFTGYDHAGHRELYLYGADTGRLICATCDPSGAPATAAATIYERNAAAASDSTSDSAQALSDDGRFVFFNSQEALVSEDTNGAPDAYEFDAGTGALHLLSSGTDPSPSYFVDATPDGSDVFIVTRQRLSGWDVDGAYDLYDARVGGGLPEPAPVPALCEGESCLPATASGPGLSAAGSESAGPGNPPRKCPKGKVRKHGKCVRKAKPKKHKSHKTGSAH
jgi:hypothetical protein